MRGRVVGVVLACTVGSCGLDIRGRTAVGDSSDATRDAAPDDAAIDSASTAGGDGGDPDASLAVDAADGAASVVTCSPPPPWASDCANGVPCISSIGDSEKCVDRQTDCLACKGAICCVIGDSTVACVEEPSQCK